MDPVSANKPRWRATVLACSVLLLTAGAASPAALGQGGQARLDLTEARIAEAEDREQVLTTEIEDFGQRIGALEVEVAALYDRLSAVRAELAAKQAELEEAIADLARARDHLRTLRARLKLALTALSERLVAIYISGPPDVVGVLLSSKGFDDLSLRSSYLAQIQDSDENLTIRVRDLRDQAERTVIRTRKARQTIKVARDAIASRETELEETGAALEAEQSEIQAVRAERENALASVSSRREQLEEVAADVRAEIQAQIAEATATAEPLPAEPAPQTEASAESSSGMIWPVDGILSSGFGPRWGSVHEGIDISAPEGTPIVAAASGTVILLQSEAESGGYGLYTCIDHGGGLSTCYAHQSGFATSAGASVSQGDVIGYVGNTGHSFGAHLHFEVRVDGVAQDPLGYL